MVVGDKVADRDKIVAVGAWPARPKASAPGVAVVAALLAEVAGLALGAFVDGVDLGGLGWSGCCPAAAPGGLAAGVGAPSAASHGGEPGPALPAHCRLGIVTHAGHGVSSLVTVLRWCDCEIRCRHAFSVSGVQGIAIRFPGPRRTGRSLVDIQW